MRIALLTDGIPPWTLGGMQKHSRLTAEYLSRQGVEVELFVPHSPAVNINAKEVFESFSIEARVNMAIHMFPYEDAGFFPGHYLRAQLSLSKSMHKTLGLIKPVDFVYCKGFMASYAAEHKDELPYQVAVGVNFHGMNMYQKQPNFKSELSKYMLRAKVKRIMKKSDFIFSYGGGITDIVRSVVGSDRVVVEVPAGIEKEQIRSRIRPSENHRNFLFIGRHDRVKGLPELYGALKGISQSGWTLKIIGPVPPKDQLHLANVIYEGQIDSKERMNSIIDDCDILICPSISEGMPNVILEAMARGLGIIASDVGAVRSLVDDSVGILIPPSDEQAIKSSILQTIQMDTDRIDEWKRNSLQRIVANFTMEKTMHKLTEFLNSLDSRN
jgi:glycosyltransferase involved in cell wall biosynthesis